MASDWSRVEVEATVSDYFLMLENELRGQPYVKAAHSERLRKVLDNRSKGAVERKHQNISAILRDIGHPWIDGYKPLGNYQYLLQETVFERLKAGDRIVGLIDESVSGDIASISHMDLQISWSEPPERSEVTYGKAIARDVGDRRPRFTNYLEKEARNQSLGLAGEELVVRFESVRLHEAGKKRLAEQVEHVSQSKGDGLGYDILSFEENGREKLIEVKTTLFGKRTPFFVTKNELECSVEREDVYHLYRVFSYKNGPGLYNITGRLDRTFSLEPFQYRARR